MKKISRLSMTVFLFGAFFAFQVKAETIVPEGVTHVDSYAADLNVSSDATIAVTETVSYNYGNQAKLGWTRYIPLNYRDLGGAKIAISVSNVTVTDQDNNPYVFQQANFQSGDKKANYLALAIDYADQPFSGSKTYVIRYTVEGAVKFGGVSDEIFWNATGDKWPIYVKYPEVTIALPQKVEISKIIKECFIGQHVATVQCINRLGGRRDMEADYSYKGVVAGEGITTVLSFPKGIVQKKVVAQQTFWLKLKTNRKVQETFLAAIFFFVVAIILLWRYFKAIGNFFSSKKYWEVLLAFGRKIKLHRVHAHAKHHVKKLRNKSRKWWITVGVIFAILFALLALVFWKVEKTLNKISVKGESVGSLVQAGLPNQSQLKGESEDRINILLLGILGANHQGGGLNTDSIMVVSIKPKAGKLSVVSIPRDLWVTDPGKETKSKLNAVYVYGQEKGAGQGISDVENMIGQITGLSIDYTAIVSTDGFKQLVDIVGGVEVDLPKPFDEGAQFADVNVCDAGNYNVPTGEFQIKKKRGRVVAQYPLCKNSNPECGGDFHLPAGKNILTGQQSLCFVRSRYLTSDFERAKRQQLVLQQLKQKIVQIGFDEFGKVNSILDTLGDNVQTDMQLWEMRRLLDLYNGMKNPKIYQRVLEDSKEGLLYAPDPTPETGYILLPRGDNYDQIRNLFQNVFNDTKGQSDIKPKI
jgi:LCP family protein required for cell wall assembly